MYFIPLSEAQTLLHVSTLLRVVRSPACMHTCPPDLMSPAAPSLTFISFPSSSKSGMKHRATTATIKAYAPGPHDARSMRPSSANMAGAHGSAGGRGVRVRARSHRPVTTAQPKVEDVKDELIRTSQQNQLLKVLR